MTIYSAGFVAMYKRKYQNLAVAFVTNSSCSSSQLTDKAEDKTLNVVVLSKIRLQHGTFKQEMPRVFYNNSCAKKATGGLNKM